MAQLQGDDVREPTKTKQEEIKICKKCKKPKSGEGVICLCGRKWFDGRDEQQVLSQLKEVWKMSGTDRDAIFFAEISASSYYRYLEFKPELVELRDTLRRYPNLKARKTIVGLLDNGEDAWKWLEKKEKEEFGTAPSVQINNNIDLSEEAKARIKKYTKPS